MSVVSESDTGDVISFKAIKHTHFSFTDIYEKKTLKNNELKWI